MDFANGKVSLVCVAAYFKGKSVGGEQRSFGSCINIDWAAIFKCRYQVSRRSSANKGEDFKTRFRAKRHSVSWNFRRVFQEFDYGEKALLDHVS